MSGKTIAITGVSGYLGRVLVPILERDAAVERIIGIDSRPPAGDGGRKLEFHNLDVRDPGVADVLSDVDVLVHMAFILMRLPHDDVSEIDGVNIGGSQAVFRAAVRRGVRRLIFVSSVVAYGLHPDNPVPLTEDSPLRPNPGLYYSRAKAAVERYLDELEAEHPEVVVTRLRPCTVVGPNADPVQMASLVGPTAVAVRGFDPPYQLIHEEDVSRAVQLMIHQEAPGAYNVTSDDWLTLTQLAASRGAKVLTLPYAVARGMMWLLWRTGRSPFAPEWVDLSRYPIVAANDRLRGLGWQPEYSTEKALQVLVEVFGPRVEV